MLLSCFFSPVYQHEGKMCCILEMVEGFSHAPPSVGILNCCVAFRGYDISLPSMCRRQVGRNMHSSPGQISKLVK